MQKNLAANIWKYALLLISNKRVFVAILGVYYLTVPGVTPQVIGTILLVSTLAGFFFEIPSGYSSDKLGHKETLVLARVFMIFSTLFFLFADTINFLFLGGIFLSIAQAFQSGTGSAFMHETFRALKREDDYTRVIGKLSSIGFAIPAVLMAMVPFLVGISYKAPFVVALVIDSMGLLVALSLVKPHVSAEHVAEIRATNFRQVLRYGQRKHFFIFALFSSIVSGILFGIGGFRAPYQAFLGIPVIWFGVLFGIGRALASLMLAYSGRIRSKLTVYSFYRWQIALYFFLILLLGLTNQPVLVVVSLILINAFQWGLSSIDGGFLLDIVKESKFKATLLSVASQIDSLISALVSFLVGYGIAHFSYQGTFTVVAFGMVACLLPLSMYLDFRYKKKGFLQKC